MVSRHRTGGLARSAALSPERRKEIASLAAKARWGSYVAPDRPPGPPTLSDRVEAYRAQRGLATSALARRELIEFALEAHGAPKSIPATQVADAPRKGAVARPVGSVGAKPSEAAHVAVPYAGDFKRPALGLKKPKP